MTLMQEAALEKLVEQGGKSVSRAMRESRLPYSPKTAKVPSKLTESVGFKKALAKYGLTEAFITRALVQDIKDKPRKRFFELNLGAEILGMKDGSDGRKNTTPVQTVIIINQPNANAQNPLFTQSKTVRSVPVPDGQ